MSGDRALTEQAAMLREQLRAVPPIAATPLDAVRAGEAALIDLVGGDRIDVDCVRDDVADHVPVRICEPGSTPPSAPQPSTTIVYLHGGGWVLGSLDSYDRLARRIASGAAARVVNVGYRLAPEHPWPAALLDARAALDWAARTFGGTVVVAGDSAGASLAAIIAASPSASRVAAQILVYPPTDAARALDATAYPAGDGWFLDAPTMEWFWATYLGAANRRRPDVSPMFTANLTGAPPALVITAEHDPLRAEVDAYADRLEAAGVPVERRHFAGVMHGFLNLGGLFPEATEAVAAITRFVGSHAR